MPGTEWASITEGHKGGFKTVAATDEAAREVDQIQYELGTGPCVDAKSPKSRLSPCSASSAKTPTAGWLTSPLTWWTPGSWISRADWTRSVPEAALT